MTYYTEYISTRYMNPNDGLVYTNTKHPPISSKFVIYHK